MKKTVIRKEKATYEFNASELVKRLRLPADARIFVKVPGGADWSNMDLEIDDLGQSLIVDVEA